MIEFYKVKKPNFSTQEEQDKSMKLIVVVISVKNRLHSILLFSCMFYSRAILLAEVMDEWMNDF